MSSPTAQPPLPPLLQDVLQAAVVGILTTVVLNLLASAGLPLLETHPGVHNTSWTYVVGAIVGILHLLTQRTMTILFRQ